MDEISLTSNFAFDRFLSLGALGYSNGMIRLLRVGTLRDEVSVESLGVRRREAQIIEASDCEILQLCFREGNAQLLAVDSLFVLTHWDLAQGPKPVAIKRV